ncbi:reverse transcriptase domain-containing protein [Pseudomonas sp. MWU349]|uniref:reverse transcriptase domain-containing protein n=1 Tax=Pseudomonas sp. MWU349 TaxID=2802572 RepID=UPI001FF0A340|nr:reverse transcriptase domain-containing protein [Pseudomonas sp. MWU349]
MKKIWDEIICEDQEIDSTSLFEYMFSAASLQAVFNERFLNNTAKGIDRVNGFQFASRSTSELTTASNKCLSGSFCFAPFLEKLKLKGRGKHPRVIGVPIIRDRVVLHQLQKYLAVIFPERVPKNIASTYVRQISENIKNLDPSCTWVCSTDIKTFYDSIEPERLNKEIAKKVKCIHALRLISHALKTPTIPKNTKRIHRSKFQQSTGVPQGLSISNILASIYMQVVDDAFKHSPDITYFRYVDDVLIYGREEPVKKAYKSLRSRLSRRGLSLHNLTSGKTQIEPLSTTFSYLGYTFSWPEITVRDSTIERFLQSIAEKLTEYKHNKAKRLERQKYLTKERLIEIFFMELNEKITGAISGKKRYGWVAYFNQITDLSLLYKMDNAIYGMLNRMSEIGEQAPTAVKKLSRAYYEMKFNPTGGYVRNYDEITTSVQKIQFLAARGRIDPSIQLTDKQIDEIYDEYLKAILAAMHSDEGEIYS